MCIIAISLKGIRQPNESELRNMFSRNSDGAGYMVAREGKVEIHKGFMNYTDFSRAIEKEHFTDDDVVVYHFRISTQGGVNPQMCQPFGLTKDISKTKALDLKANVGIAHNGIIPLTTDRTDMEYSDTAHFVAEYLPHLIKKAQDIRNPFLLDIIEEVINSRMVFLSGDGNVSYVGNGWIRETSGLLFSNSTYKEVTYNYVKNTKWHNVIYR